MTMTYGHMTPLSQYVTCITTIDTIIHHILTNYTNNAYISYIGYRTPLRRRTVAVGWTSCPPLARRHSRYCLSFSLLVVLLFLLFLFLLLLLLLLLLVLVLVLVLLLLLLLVLVLVSSSRTAMLLLMLLCAMMMMLACTFEGDLIQTLVGKSSRIEL
jgi:hypothetical protein